MNEKTLTRIDDCARDVLDIIKQWKAGEIESGKIDAVLGIIENRTSCIQDAIS